MLHLCTRLGSHDGDNRRLIYFLILYSSHLRIQTVKISLTTKVKSQQPGCICWYTLHKCKTGTSKKVHHYNTHIGPDKCYQADEIDMLPPTHYESLRVLQKPATEINGCMEKH